MRPTVLVALGLLLACDNAPTRQLESASEAIWWGGVFLGEGPWPADGETLVVLHRTSAGTRVDSLAVSVRTVPNACAEWATELLTLADSAPFLLVRGLPLRVGAVPTVFDGYAFIRPSDTLVLHLGAVQYMLTAEGRADPVQSGGFLDYRLALSVGALRQVIHEADGVLDGPPTIRWAGDLDGDHRLDLLGDFAAGYAPTNRTLLLSGRSAPDSLVRTYATRTHPGC